MADLPVFIMILVTIAGLIAGAGWGINRGYRVVPALLLCIAAVIVYGLYVQCPGIAVYRRC